MSTRSWRREGWLVLLAACALGLGCSSSDLDNARVQLPGDYMLGGQTGSLIPGCGVAPLSASGRSVPSGDALAVIYTSECPDALAEVSRLGADTAGVDVELEPLAGTGAYLVRARAVLTEGSYELSLPGAAGRTLAVEDDAPALPAQLGALTPLAPDSECPGSLEFALDLDPAALAYAPLLRLWVSIDDGDGQLWIEYGALELDAEVLGRALLELPRCGGTCLEPGVHSIEVRAEIAGESQPIDEAFASFEVECGAALIGALPAPEQPAPAGCSSTGRSSVTSPLGAALAAAVALSLHRRTRRRCAP